MEAPERERMSRSGVDLTPSVNNYEKSKVVPYDKGGRPGTVSLLEGGSDTAGSSGVKHPRSRFQDWYLEISFNIFSLSSLVRRAAELLEVSFIGLFPHKLISSLMLALPIPPHQESAFQHMDFRGT